MYEIKIIFFWQGLRIYWLNKLNISFSVIKSWIPNCIFSSIPFSFDTFRLVFPSFQFHLFPFAVIVEIINISAEKEIGWCCITEYFTYRTFFSSATSPSFMTETGPASRFLSCVVAGLTSFSKRNWHIGKCKSFHGIFISLIIQLIIHMKFFSPLLRRERFFFSTYSGTAGVGGGIGGGGGAHFISCTSCSTAIPFWNCFESNAFWHMCMETSFTTIWLLAFKYSPHWRQAKKNDVIFNSVDYFLRLCVFSKFWFNLMQITILCTNYYFSFWKVLRNRMLIIYFHHTPQLSYWCTEFTSFEPL